MYEWNSLWLRGFMLKTVWMSEFCMYECIDLSPMFFFFFGIESVVVHLLGTNIYLLLLLVVVGNHS